MASGFAYHNSDGDATWISQHKFDRLQELLDENQRANTIIVYNYKEELAQLKRLYPNLQTMDDKDVVERWNSGSVELLALHPKSAGHGLNLQFGGCTLVFLSLPWSLELYEQTIGRLHRSGQKHDVWVYALLTERTIDERIWTALQEKRGVSDAAVKELRG
jgi:SNF2 family DNA or RNA helicase